jgi:hypothetical protein
MSCFRQYIAVFTNTLGGLLNKCIYLETKFALEASIILRRAQVKSAAYWLSSLERLMKIGFKRPI